MNLPIFLKEVDSLTAGLSHDELERFIHEMARTWPEDRRSHFIRTLRSVGKISEATGIQDMVKDDGYANLMNEIEAVKSKLIQINEGAYCLDSQYNEEWDDWYNSWACIIVKSYER